MKKPENVKKVLKLSEIDRKVLREYSGICHETGLKVAAGAAAKQEIHK